MNDSRDTSKRDWQQVDAERYHRQTGDFANRVDRAVVEELIGGEPGGKALDLPCGSGRMAPVLGKRHRIFFADYSWAMLEFARNDPDFVGARVDAFRLGFADDSFDLLLSLRLSFHYPDFGEALSEFFRVLRPGGILILDSLNRWTLRWLLASPIRLIRGSGARRVHFRSRKEMRKILENCGFQVERVESRYLLPTRLYRFLPSPAQNFFLILENLLPASLRVLTYWRVRKPERTS